MTDIVREELKKWINQYIGKIFGGGVPDDIIDMYLASSNRVLYDFYDSYDVQLSIIYNNEDKLFGYIIDGKDIIGTTTEPYKSRLDAEKKGFEECNILLNEKLCKQK